MMKTNLNREGVEVVQDHVCWLGKDGGVTLK